MEVFIMKKILLSILSCALTGFTFNSSAACFQLTSFQVDSAFDVICLNQQGTAELHKNQQLITEFPLNVEYIPAHYDYAPGLAEGHRVFVSAAYRYSNLSSSSQSESNIFINATVPLKKGTADSHEGCNGKVNNWVKNKKHEYCFKQDMPINDL